MLALLVALQDFAGALDDAAGQAGEAGDFDAVTFVGAARLNAAEKNDFAGRFFHRNVNILHAGEKVGEFGELVIVGGEERARASVLLEMLDHSPSDGEAVERGGAAANLIEEDEAGRSGVIENSGDFAHFDQEGGTPTREIVTRADAREDSVGDGQFRLARRNERAHLRHEND